MSYRLAKVGVFDACWHRPEGIHVLVIAIWIAHPCATEQVFGCDLHRASIARASRV